jgi:hypothetical protein
MVLADTTSRRYPANAAQAWADDRIRTAELALVIAL